MKVQKAAARFLTCLAGTAIMAGGCKKIDYGYPSVEERGYYELGINITGPNTVPNITIKIGQNRYDQYGARATGSHVMTFPYASSFVLQKDTVPKNQLISPQSTTGFFANRYTIVEMKEGNKTIRYLPEQGATVVYKGENLKADSLNTNVNGGFLYQSRWVPQ